MLSVGADPVLVERKLVSGGLACPDCAQPLAPWGQGCRKNMRRPVDPAQACARIVSTLNRFFGRLSFLGTCVPSPEKMRLGRLLSSTCPMPWIDG